MKIFTVFESATGRILSRGMLANDSDMLLQPDPPAGFVRAEGIYGDWQTQRVEVTDGVPVVVDL